MCLLKQKQQWQQLVYNTIRLNSHWLCTGLHSMTFPTRTQNSDPSQGLEPGSLDVESIRLHILPHPISNSHIISQAWGGSKRRGWGGLVEPPTFKNYWDIITIWLDLTMPEIPFPLKTFRLNHSGRDCPLQPPTQPHQPLPPLQGTTLGGPNVEPLPLKSCTCPSKPQSLMLFHTVLP